MPGTEDAVLSERRPVPCSREASSPAAWGGRATAWTVPYQLSLSALSLSKPPAVTRHGLPTAHIPFSQELGGRADSRPFAGYCNGPPYYGLGLVLSLAPTLFSCLLTA